MTGLQVIEKESPTSQSSGRRGTLPGHPKEEVTAGEMQKQGPEAKSLQSGQDVNRTNQCRLRPRIDQVNQCSSPSSKTQDTR